MESRENKEGIVDFFEQALKLESEAYKVKKLLINSPNYKKLIDIKHISDSKKKSYEDSLQYTPRVRAAEDGEIEPQYQETMKSQFIASYYRLDEDFAERVNKLASAQSCAELLEILKFTQDVLTNFYAGPLLFAFGCVSQTCNAGHYMRLLAYEIIKLAADNKYAVESRTAPIYIHSSNS